MRFTDTTRYGLRALVELARQPLASRSVRSLHETQQIPYKYLGRLMVTLGEAGLVVATRGKHGGYRLARDPRAITLEQVVGALQGFDGFRECLLGLYACGAGGSACALHSRMEPLRTALSATLRDTTLVDLAGTAAATATGAGPSPARFLPI